MIQEIPTPEEELDRKSMDELGRILHLFESGRITHREMNLMLDTLWACISGLTSEDWRVLIEEARQVEDDQRDWRYVAFQPESRQFVVAWREEEEFEVVIRDDSWRIIKQINKVFGEEEMASVENLRAWNAVIDALTKKGFCQL